MADRWLSVFRLVSYVSMSGVFLFGIVVWFCTSKLEHLDKRTRKHATTRRWQILAKVGYYVFGLFVLISAIGQSYCGDLKDDGYNNKIDRLVAQNYKLTEGQGRLTLQNTQLVGGQKELVAQNSDLVRGKDKLISQQSKSIVQNGRLLDQNRELTTRVQTLQAYLRKKDERIAHLETIAREARRGITSSYDYNGARHDSIRSGHIRLTHGTESEVFRTMQQLAQEGRTQELVSLCEGQIKRTPEWLTPYLYLGVAYADMGRKEDAIRNLEHVVKESHGDPDYAKAAEILQRLRQ